ncbi:MAG: hypothetical protein JWM86_1023 [Thermoleophilia bacterium]|nr:hypothetical protein [Thermoleophilia bacterium]
MSSDRHVFRFFVDAVGGSGIVVELDQFDERHARVLLRGHAADPVEVVDRDGAIWHATFDGPSARLVLGELVDTVVETSITLFAVAQVGGRFDDLVDGATQAGVTQIVPVVRRTKDRTRIDARHERLMRIASTAAKQSKRAGVPVVLRSIGLEELRAEAAGIVVDAAAELLLDEVVRDVAAGGGEVRLLVGGSDGLPDGLAGELAAAGWRRGRLGPSILRAELAAAVAVAVASMHASARE